MNAEFKQVVGSRKAVFTVLWLGYFFGVSLCALHSGAIINWLHSFRRGTIPAVIGAFVLLWPMAILYKVVTVGAKLVMDDDKLRLTANGKITEVYYKDIAQMVHRIPKSLLVISYGNGRKLALNPHNPKAKLLPEIISTIRKSTSMDARKTQNSKGFPDTETYTRK